MIQKVGNKLDKGINGQKPGKLSIPVASTSFLSTESGKNHKQATTSSTTFLQRLWITPLFWVAADAVLINIAFALAYIVRYEFQWLRAVDPASNVPYTAFLPFIGLLTVLLLLFYNKEKGYRIRRKISWLDEMYNIFNGTTTGIIIVIALIFFYQPTFYSRIIFLYTGAFILLFLGISHWLKVALLSHWRQKGFGVTSFLIVGAGEVARTVMRSVVANPGLGYSIVGFIDDDIHKGQTNIGRFEALGGIGKLSELLQEKHINEVIITLPWQYHRKIMSISAVCERNSVKIRIVPDLFQMTLSNLEVDEMAGVPLVGMKQTSISGGNLILKRVIDFTGSLLGLALLSPIMALLALAIKLESPGSVIFTQDRVGKGGKRFKIYKFRSMVDDAESQKEALLELNEADGPIFKIKDDPRMTNVGRLLRRLSLDELPQLYNVLRGEMSLIGPRPGIPEEVAQYQSWHKRRLEIVPGITGMWQVSGRSDVTFDEMALLDIYYGENWSLALDIKIALRTIPSIILRSGAY